MEPRKITIVSNKTGCSKTLTTSATTLGELKNDMKTQGINYSDCTFTEGISKTKLIDDSSVLPTNVQFKGKTTNDLLMLLTVSVDKITSGINIERVEVIQIIESLGIKKK